MKHFISAILLTCCPLALNSQATDQKPPQCEVIQSEMILHNPPFKQCHASTIAELKDGSLLVAFFGGSYEGAPDVKIWSTKLKNGRWTDPAVLASGSINDTLSHPCWNPVLFRSKAGVLYLFYKVGPNPREWTGMMKTSGDDGMSWSDPLLLPDGLLGPVRNKPVELADGTLLCPSSTETPTEWKVQMELFNPALNSWRIIKVDQESHYQVIQPTILAIRDGSYRILCRSKSNAVISSLSTDRGATWSSLTPISLLNPNSGIDGITLRDNSHLLVYNPLTSGREWSDGRNQLNLAWSADGLNWIDIHILEKEDTGEFSYPAIIQSADGQIHITYTYNRVQVRYWGIRL